MLASTTRGRAKEFVKQGLSDRNGMIAFGRIRERFGKTASVAKLSVVCQFQWTSTDGGKWLRWLKLLRQVNMTSLGDDARETLTIAGLEKAKERSLEQHLRLRAPQTWTVLCASVDQYLRTTVDSSSQPTPMEVGAVMSSPFSCSPFSCLPFSCSPFFLHFPFPASPLPHPLPFPAPPPSFSCTLPFFWLPLLPFSASSSHFFYASSSLLSAPPLPFSASSSPFSAPSFSAAWTF